MNLQRLLAVILSTVLLLPASCKDEHYEKYQSELFDIFDTYTQITIYAKNQNEFEYYEKIIHDRLDTLNKYFDIYHSYDGINNLYTINEQAGIAPVLVCSEIIELLKFSEYAYNATNGTVNAALGRMLNIWHTYREDGLRNPALAELPPRKALEDAMSCTDIGEMQIDSENNTVFLTQPCMLLDVGALAKGFAAQLVVNELKSYGVKSCLINIGGNVVTLGKPMENDRLRWSVGIQDPSKSNDKASKLLDVIYGNDIAVVTSGDYQRYYVVNSVKYNHIIDPETLMPANRYLSVSVVHSDAGIADMLSTALFILPYEKGRSLAEEYQAAVLWVMPDQSVITNTRYNEISKNYGGRSASD